MAAGDLLIIFGAKYLFLAIPAGALLYFLRQPAPERRRLLFLGATALPVIYVIAKIAGSLYYDPPPFVQTNFIPLVPHGPDNGFPSEHTLFGAAISAVDRKSTRLNSSHSQISYAVFCLKKKNIFLT